MNTLKRLIDHLDHLEHLDSNVLSPHDHMIHMPMLNRSIGILMDLLPNRQSLRILDLMASKRIKLSNQVRQAVDDCGLSRYAIGKATGIGQDTLSRFMSGERGLPMKTLDRLADFLDLNIVAGKPRKAGKA